ncbi:hypothetical protein K440DRAFT_635718 [Wilcoxina mikolae CBS 423.85]|nr:hypothetical protein K440DRAFT_635718 [Wilcoxina mikolae CBS 423.85]
MTFLHKYECLAAFTATDITESSIISMFPYYCVDESTRDKVMMMRGYADRQWATLKTEMLDVFRHTDSRSDSVICTHRYLEQLCAEFGGRHDTESLKSFLRAYNHISAVLMERGMMCEKVITKLGMHPIEPSTFDFGKLKDWIIAKITAAEALSMFEFLAPAAALTTLVSTTPSASLTSASMMAPTTPTSTGIASPTNLTVHTAPTVEPTAPSAPTTSLAFSNSTAPSRATQGPQVLWQRFVNPHRKSALAHCHVEQQPCYYCADDHNSRKCADLHTDLEKGLISINDKGRLVFERTYSEIAMEPAIRDYYTMRDCARTEAWLLLPQSPPSPPPVCPVLSSPQPPLPPPPAQLSRTSVPLPSPEQLTQLVRVVTEHFAQPEPIRPHRTESTVTCRSEPAPSNRPKPMQPHGQEPAPPNCQEPVKLSRSEPIIPSHNQPVPPYCQEAVQPQPCQEPVQPSQQVDRSPYYYCADDQHNLRKCTDLRTDLGKGIVSINNRDRLVLGTAGAEIPMVPAARDFRTIRDYARAGAPILPLSPAPRRARKLEQRRSICV